MTRTEAACERCGAPANVHASEVIDGASVIRHFCNDCYDSVHIEPPDRRRRWGEAAVLASVGLVVLALSISADWHRLGKFAGFGWQQKVGVVLGGVVIVFGAVARSPLLLIMGMVTMLLSLMADWLAFGESAGFGWKQMLGTALGVALLLAAYFMTRTKTV